MKFVEELAREFITAYYSGNQEKATQQAKIILHNIKKDEWQLKRVKHPYLVAKSFYYLLTWNKIFLTEEENVIVTKLIYYCLLKNYTENIEIETLDIKHEDVIAGSELAFIFICENGDSLMYQILIGLLSYMPQYAQNHLLNQMRVFGGLVKNALEKNHHYYLDEALSKRFEHMLQEVYENIPTSEDLQHLKKDSLPTIQRIMKDLEYSLKSEDDDYIW